MKTLTLIIAAGAVVAALAPAAGAKNSLQCAVTSSHIGGRTIDPEVPFAYQVQRNLLGKVSCKSLQQAKGGTTPDANRYQVVRDSL
jgi:hypothetical protein